MQSAAPPGPLGANVLRRLSARAMEVLFPARCANCDAHLRRAPNPWFCGACWGSLPVQGPVGCARCGRPIEAEVLPPGWCCSDCLQVPPAYLRARVLGAYEGVLAEGIKLLKYRDRPGLARALVARMPMASAPPDLWEVDLVVPVPLHPQRLRDRGYNQAARLGMAMAARLRCPVAEGVLERAKATRPQVGLGRSARAANVRSAFRVAGPGRVADRRVLLVDDVITTGATVRACARALVRAGARGVTVWAVARQEGPGAGGA